MGLDMYAGTLKQAPLKTVDFADTDCEPLHYWRKHPNLHGWMEALYREKGGDAHSFNCVAVQVTAADLDRLEHTLKSASLPEMTGFFFGESDGSETEDDLVFVAKAREAIAAGLTVFYTSWW